MERFAQGEGYLQVVDNSALLIVEDAIEPEDIDERRWSRELKEAEQPRDGADEDSEERRRAERDIERAKAFLEIDSGS